MHSVRSKILEKEEAWTTLFYWMECEASGMRESMGLRLQLEGLAWEDMKNMPSSKTRGEEVSPSKHRTILKF